MGGDTGDLSDSGLTAVHPCENLAEALQPVDEPAGEPPYWGTVWFSPEILVETDPSSFREASYEGTGLRTMYDRRSASWVELEAHLFDARFVTDTHVEIQVNPEFTAEEAEVEARYYAHVIGQLPVFLFADLETVWIHRGVELYGGGNNNLLIHTGQTPEYVADGVLEEVFLHEGAHTSLDPHLGADPLWSAAQDADGMSLSQYGLDYPAREDLAETLGPYLALRHRPERMDPDLLALVTGTIPNRLLFLDCLGLSPDLVP
jgi:hypothetical protein